MQVEIAQERGELSPAERELLYLRGHKRFRDEVEKVTKTAPPADHSYFWVNQDTLFFADRTPKTTQDTFAGVREGLFMILDQQTVSGRTTKRVSEEPNPNPRHTHEIIPGKLTTTRLYIPYGRYLNTMPEYRWRLVDHRFTPLDSDEPDPRIVTLGKGITAKLPPLGYQDSFGSFNFLTNFSEEQAHALDNLIVSVPQFAFDGDTGITLPNIMESPEIRTVGPIKLFPFDLLTARPDQRRHLLNKSYW